MEAINKDSSLIDAYYNANRLLFHVWEVYHSVPKSHLKSIEGCYIHELSLSEVRQKHEFVVQRFEDVTWELYYNLVLINTEFLENEDLSFDEMQTVCTDSVVLVGKVLDYHLKELDSFLKRLENPEVEDEEVRQNTDDDKEDDYDMIETITPSIVLDTLLTGAKFISASYESCENYIQINALKSGFIGFESRLQEVLQLLMSKFSPEVNPTNEFGLNFQPQEIEEIKLVKHSMGSFFINDFDQLVQYWKALDDTINTASRFMAEVDSVQNYKDREQLDSQQQWIVINHMNSNLKKAQELVKDDLQLQISNKTNEVSSRVSKIIEILILRADNELQRSSFNDLESSVKNREILRQNTVNLLKNGLNMSNTNCGLRETVSDRLRREKLRRECLIRLVVLTRDSFGEPDLIRNLGADHYLNEVEDLKSNELYRSYF